MNKIERLFNASLLVTMPLAPLTAFAQDDQGGIQVAITEEIANQNEIIAEARNAIVDAKKLTEADKYQDGVRLLDEILRVLPRTSGTEPVVKDIEQAKIELKKIEAQNAFARGDVTLARQLMTEVKSAGVSLDAPEFTSLTADLNNPYKQDIAQINPDYVKRYDEIQTLVVRGKAQFINGDLVGAGQTFKEVLIRDPENTTAKAYSAIINEELISRGTLDRYNTKSELLRIVSDAWKLPQVYDRDINLDETTIVDNLLREKLRSLKIDKLNYSSGRPLSAVIEDLSESSRVIDPAGTGVNIVFLDRQSGDPEVRISLFDISLEEALDYITRSVGYDYEVEEKAVTISRAGTEVATGDRPAANLKTRVFPVSRATLLLITGGIPGQGSGGGGGGFDDPFNPGGGDAFGGGGGGSTEDEAANIRSFLERAGVDFENVNGSSVAYADTRLYVTQTPRNLEKVQTILRDFDSTKQVEIEAKFLEVQEGALEELGVQWGINRAQNDAFFSTNAVTNDNFLPTGASQNLRSLSNISTGITTVDGSVIQNGQQFDVPNSAPTFPNAINLATGAGSVAGWLSVFGDWNVAASIRALEQKTGSDLMSAPKLTVLSGKTAEITVGQEFIYPESYGDVEAEVSAGDAGGDAVAITAGTPQDFTDRVVGVEMRVTPTVEEDDKISLELEPKVTEFEGFVEYGGQSVAVTNDTVVRVPSGFFQPIFSSRQISTQVTIFDGATVVMGGLTREEVQSVNDKVPVLGNIPLLGKLFRSEGETVQKRNLLIFVTANLMSPGGSPTRQRFNTVAPNSLFQNPIIVTPGGPAPRTVPETR